MALKSRYQVVNTAFTDIATVKVGNGDLIETLGYYAAGDGGGNLYRYEASSVAVTNGGTILDAPTGLPGKVLSANPLISDIRKWGGRPNIDCSTFFSNAVAGDAGVFFPGHSTNWLFNSPVENPNCHPIVCEGYLTYGGSAVTGAGTHGYAIRYGQMVRDGGGVAQPIVATGTKHVIRLKRNAMTWDNSLNADNICGIRLFNVIELDMHLIEVWNFRSAVHIYSEESACAYLDFKLGSIWNNREMAFIETTSHADSYCNGITFYGGRVTTTGTTDTAQTVSCIRGLARNAHTLDQLEMNSVISELYNGDILDGAGVNISVNPNERTYCWYGDPASTVSAVFQRCRMNGGRHEFTDYVAGGKGFDFCEFDITYFEGIASLDDFVQGKTADAFASVSESETLKILAQNRFVVNTNEGRDEWKKVASFGRSNVTTLTVVGNRVTAPARCMISTNNLYFRDADLVTTTPTSVRIGTGGVRIFGCLIDLGYPWLETSPAPHVAQLMRRIRVTADLAAAGGRFWFRPFSSTFVALQTADDCSLTWDGSFLAFQAQSDLGIESDYPTITDPVTPLVNASQTVAFSEETRYVFVGIGNGGTNVCDFRNVNIFLPAASAGGLILDAKVDTVTQKFDQVAPSSGYPMQDTDWPISNNGAPLDSLLSGDREPTGKICLNVLDSTLTATKGWVRKDTAWEAF